MTVEGGAIGEHLDGEDRLGIGDVAADVEADHSVEGSAGLDDVLHDAEGVFCLAGLTPDLEADEIMVFSLVGGGFTQKA